MTNVIQFPKIEKRPIPVPRKRVFYVGYRYVGPMFCQDVQNLYLKRKGVLHGTRYWSMITYAKYDEFDKRTYSIELEECAEDDVPEMLEMFEIDDFTFADLEEMGWRSTVHCYSADVIQLFETDLR